jgi:hypothetical protein
MTTVDEVSSVFKKEEKELKALEESLNSKRIQYMFGGNLNNLNDLYFTDLGILIAELRFSRNFNETGLCNYLLNYIEQRHNQTKIEKAKEFLEKIFGVIPRLIDAERIIIPEGVFHIFGETPFRKYKLQRTQLQLVKPKLKQKIAS